MKIRFPSYGTCSILALGIALLIALPRPAAAESFKELIVRDQYLLKEIIDRAGDDEINGIKAKLKLATNNSIIAAASVDSMSEKEIRHKLTERLIPSRWESDEGEAKKQKDRQEFANLLGDTTLNQLAGAYTVAVTNLQNECGKKHPRIHNIGKQAILTFESARDARSTRTGERAVRIPVDGYDLDPRCISIGVQIGGTVPVSRYGQTERWPQRPDVHIQMPTVEQPDIANIVLLEPFIDRLKTGDKITVSISLSNRYPKTNGESERRTTFPNRIFTMYEIEDYRTKFLASRIAPHDFAAFPLPEPEAKALFGPLVSKNYFVVRLSIRNTDTQAKLVSTGMIRAAGTARIEPKDREEQPYAVPITVVPHSLQQIYKLVQDEEVDQPRPTFFRGLELFGALATGVQAVTNAGIQASKNLGFFTGILIPESKRAWPDRWPGYQANIVNFAMPDLMKVPSNAVVDHKFLFFSKQEIDGLVSDPNLFRTSRFLPNGTTLRDGVKPDAFVISLEFDNIDIRFETVFPVAAVTTRDRVLELSSRLSKQLANMADAKEWYDSTVKSKSLFGLNEPEWKRISDLLDAIDTQVKAHPNDAEIQAFKNGALKQVRALSNATKAIDKKSSIYTDLFGSKKEASANLSAQSEKLRQITQKMNSGVDPELMKEQVDAIATVIDGNRDVVRFFQEATHTLRNHEPMLNAIKEALSAGKIDDAAKKKISDADTAISEANVALEKLKPQNGVNFKF